MGMVGIWAKLAAKGGVSPRGERRWSEVQSGTFSEYRLRAVNERRGAFRLPLLAVRAGECARYPDYGFPVMSPWLPPRSGEAFFHSPLLPALEWKLKVGTS